MQSGAHTVLDPADIVRDGDLSTATHWAWGTVAKVALPLETSPSNTTVMLPLRASLRGSRNESRGSLLALAFDWAV